MNQAPSIRHKTEVSMAFALTLSLLVLAATRAGAEPASDAPEAPIKVVSVRTSSHLKPWKGYTFDAANLIDGRVDTSWQPAKNDTMGVGQWIELDLGQHYEITRIELAQGLQKEDPKLGDLFCRNNRLSDARIWLDDGTRGHINRGLPESSYTLEVLRFHRGSHTSEGDAAKTAARRLRIIVELVIAPVDWHDLAIAEVRVFGRPVDPPPPRTGAFSWEGPESWPFRVAVSDYCAVDHRRRANRLCGRLTGMMGSASFVPRLQKPITEEDLTQGTFEFVVKPFRLTFSRPTADSPWTITKGSLDAEALSRGHSDEEYISYHVDDYHNFNPCWKKLGATNEHAVE